MSMVLKSPSVLCRSVTMRLKKLKPCLFGDLTMVIGKGSYVQSGQVEWFWWM